MADVAGNVAVMAAVEQTEQLSGIMESVVTAGVQAWEGNQPPETGTSVRSVPALVRVTP